MRDKAADIMRLADFKARHVRLLRQIADERALLAMALPEDVKEEAAKRLFALDDEKTAVCLEMARLEESLAEMNAQRDENSYSL